jgi:hypothetical protein
MNSRSCPDRHAPNLLVFLLLVTVLLGGHGCTTVQSPKFESPDVTATTATAAAGGLKVSARPVLDPEESNRYFGTDLAAENILAIFIRIENTDGAASYILPREQISYSDTNSAARDTAGTLADGNLEEAAVMTGAVFSPLVMWVGLTEAGNDTVRQHALKSNEYQTRTLSPGGVAEGFVYFTYPDLKSGYNPGVLKLVGLDPVTRRTVELQVPIRE